MTQSFDRESTAEMLLKETARQNFLLWNSALQTKNPETVAKLYGTDATFLPTVSGEFKRGRGGVEEYFRHFLEKNPSGEIVEEEVQTLGENCYLHSGIYNFEVDSGEGARQIIEARFTFVWKKDERNEWKILHHHSSVRPK